MKLFNELHPRGHGGKFKLKLPEYVAKRREILHNAASTAALWTRWSPSRHAMIYRDSRRPLHDRNVAVALAGVTPPTGRPPRATYAMGGAGSGSTTVLESLHSDLKHDAVHVDPDKIKAQLPEWEQLVAASDPQAAKLTHDESLDISRRIQYEAMQRGLDVVIDGTGAGPSFLDRIRETKRLKQGYTVDVLWTTTSVKTALQRVHERAKETGRALPDGLVRLIHRDSAARLPEVISNYELIDNVRIYENEDAPVLIYERQGISETAVDKPALLRLWEKSRAQWTKP